MAKLQILANVPADVRLLSTEGEAAPSNYGPDEYKYRTDQGPLFVSDAVAKIFDAAIAQHGIKAGDLVRIVKAAGTFEHGRKGVRWSLTPAAGEASNGTLAVPRIAPQAAPAAQAAPLPMTRPATKLEDALKTVIAAVYAAQTYAREIGFTAMPPFTSEDIRTMANTLVIQDNGGRRNAA